MFFKRMEIVGFKSFSSKTVLDFLPGITIIVGPNGCGKSNIFDAVRWALGEQRPRVLRGQRMGDVIFSGSTSYKAQSMASVTLTINNEDRRLPLDFSEIQVARRLYKVGENEYDSEYLLNRTPCRLRQITELFMDTGVGTNSYSVMEQGQVDFIINARPPERRFLFDEAVGISKYRSRRDEALRKLEKTEADLLRLNDILSEVKSRLRSLKIQANRAERYKHLVADLRILERDLMLLGYRDLQAEKAKVDEQYDALNATVQGIVAQMAKIEEAVMGKQVELDRREREAESDHARRLEKATELERAQSQRAVLRERIDTTEAQMRRDESQIGALRELRGQLADRRERVVSHIHEVTEELARLDSDYESHRQRYEELVRSQSDTRERLAELREKTRTAVEAKQSHENERRIAALMKEQAEENRENARAQLREVEARETEIAQRLERFEADRNEQRQTLTEVQAELERSETEQRERGERLRALEEEKAAVIRARHEAESRRQALRSLQENYEGFVHGIRELMAAAGRGEIRGVVGIVANLLESLPDDELAIETALAGHLQDVVVETETAALDCLKFLRRGELGRGTFLPLDRIAFPPRDVVLTLLSQHPGVVGIAADLVRTQSRFRPITEALLGRTVIVESLETAQLLRGRGLAVVYVARDGTVLTPAGAVTGGHVRPSGLFGREREIRELTEKIEWLDQELAHIELRAGELTAEIEAAAVARESLAEKANGVRNQLIQIEREIERVAEDRADVQRALELARREIERLTEKIAGHDSVLEEHRRALEESDAHTAALQSQLAQVETAHESRDQQVSVLQETLAQMMAQVSVGRERLEATQKRAAETDEEIARCDEQIRRHTEQLESLSRTLDQACAEFEQSGKRLEELKADMEAMDRALAESANRREALSAEIQQKQHELHAVQRQHNEQQNELHEIDRRRAQCEVQLQNLDDQAREKFREPLEDLAREAGAIETPSEQLVVEIAKLRGRIESMGEVNVIAIEEHRKLSERYEFLLKQRDDLEEAKASLRKTIRTIDDTITEMFTTGMAAIRERFREIFRRLFGGGRADLILTDPEDLLGSGIEILAQPPGKQLQSITLLSGGEKALTAIALLFGIFMYRPSPFCVLDEIDAPLDDANIEHFKNLVLEFSKDVQFIIITHNKQTMALADTLHGVTMEEMGVSRIVSVRFDQIEQTALAG